MNENRLVAVLALAIFVPGVLFALRDFRKGRGRVLVLRRARL